MILNKHKVFIMKISLDGFDNTIACSDLEVGDNIFISERRSGKCEYTISNIDRENEYISLYKKGIYMHPIKFDDLVDRNAFIIKNS